MKRKRPTQADLERAYEAVLPFLAEQMGFPLREPEKCSCGWTCPKCELDNAMNKAVVMPVVQHVVVLAAKALGCCAEPKPKVS